MKLLMFMIVKLCKFIIYDIFIFHDERATKTYEITIAVLFPYFCGTCIEIIFLNLQLVNRRLNRIFITRNLNIYMIAIIEVVFCLLWWLYISYGTSRGHSSEIHHVDLKRKEYNNWALHTNFNHIKGKYLKKLLEHRQKLWNLLTLFQFIRNDNKLTAIIFQLKYTHAKTDAWHFYSYRC